MVKRDMIKQKLNEHLFQLYFNAMKFVHTNNLLTSSAFNNILEKILIKEIILYLPLTARTW